MAVITPTEIQEIKKKLTDDPSMLGKLYKAKKSPFDTLSVVHGMVEDYLDDGWEVEKELKTKTRIRKEKAHSRIFEDEVWCQLYELGYRHFNYDNHFKLPYGKNPEDKKQIDVIAVDQDTVIIIECKSSAKAKNAPSLKTEFEGLDIRLKGFRRAISEVFGKHMKMKYIFATKKLRIDPEGVDVERLIKTGGFYYNDNTYKYINSLIKNYQNAARYQFLGILFKGETINSNKIEIPAIEGSMGEKKYYMFSIEPLTILKLGFVLHRTKANESEMPTYQRLLVPSRLKGINKFINDGGYFPNSIIINFSQDKKNRVIFEANPRASDTDSRHGQLKIPNAYAIAYIIDGQHRVYGYANSNYLDNNTIPVVAFTDLQSVEQLEIFMNINQNQKAVSPSLRGTLERDLYWNSDRVDTRLKALRSSIIIELSESTNGPLYNKIQVGEDTALLKFTPISDGIKASGLLPKARGNAYIEETTTSCLYDTHNNNHSGEMQRCQKATVNFINCCFSYVEENYPTVYESKTGLFLSNRGAQAFITLIGKLNHWESTVNNNIDRKTKAEDRLASIKKYLDVLLTELNSLSEEEQSQMLNRYGTGAADVWIKTFQQLINEKIISYDPPELIEWKERQDKDLQNKGRELGVSLEKYLKKTVLDKLEVLFGDNLELEINNIVSRCDKLARDEMEKNYKADLETRKIHWTEMLNILDYYTIIDNYWIKKPEGDTSFTSFEDNFALDTGEGLGSKKKALKWMKRFNSLRNNWAHEGTKEKGLSKEEVDFIENIHSRIIRD